jgi:UDP-N-acetylmuramoyl-L-alanyl-D-glutamate--2,6-diaminopimelate ligase
MKIKKLFKDIIVKAIKGSKDIEITGLCSNSKLVAPGNLFIAKKGRTTDGNKFITDAVSAGAVAVLTDIYDPSLKNIVQIIHPDVVAIEGAIAAQYYESPSDHLFIVGITGTNGKTTTAFLIKHLFDKLKEPCGLMGTIEYIVGEHHYQATHTTPDVITNQKMLREMVNHGCTTAVMEVTSHALDQRRVSNVEYDVAVFTNLTVDHLDYHLTMEDYCKAKNKLFRSLDNKKSRKLKPFHKTAVINGDSPWKQQMIEECPACVFTYGIENACDLQATNIQLSGKGTTFDLTFKEEITLVTVPLVGRFNVYNFLAALSVGLVKGEPLIKLLEIFKSFKPVPGRLEPVQNSLGLKIFVDFAHTDDALINVLECLKEFKKGRIITVFGCGGDRDRTKRPKMAVAAEDNSDICIVTSDNPRSEDPQAIIQEVVKGFKKPSQHILEPDRRKAIEKAVEMANDDDIILIAGKGHEKFQIFAHKTIEFDDRKVAQESCSKLTSMAAS